jgi:2-hydroxychromene-2-carboxylate isomerase
MPQQDSANDRALRFYFSFRSPYSWLALHRTQLAAERSGLAIEYIPVFPPADFPNDPTKIPAKLEYVRLDIVRMARAYGLEVKLPASMDCDWVRPHAAFIFALDLGRGAAFAKQVYEARFVRGDALGDDAVIARCAEAVGLEPTSVVAAQGDKALQERVVLGMIRGVQEDGLFGVPLLVYQGERFWGNDRVEWLLRRIDERRGASVPDLVAAPLGPVHRTP